MLQRIHMFVSVDNTALQPTDLNGHVGRGTHVMENMDIPISVTLGHHLISSAKAPL